MRIAAVHECVDDSRLKMQPWIFHADALADSGIHIDIHQGMNGVLERQYDAILLHVFQDWDNYRLFDAARIMPVLSDLAVYRAMYPDTVQIVVNHTDMATTPYVFPCWRPGDPVLYRTPPYDRSMLAPIEPKDVWAYEHVWGWDKTFPGEAEIKYRAGFIGTPTGPRGYRYAVARAVEKIGLGICAFPAPMTWKEYSRALDSCRVVICPRGWGHQSKRHWDAWRSGKPVLTDKHCAEVELIPGKVLEEGVHYLVYDEPEAIPDIVNDWTKPSRLDDLAAIARQGREAVYGYNARAWIQRFFQTQVAPRVGQAGE